MRDRNAILAIIAAAFGYFVDVYDVWLFSVLRVSSLKGLGYTSDLELKQLGEFLFNTQMVGFILGSIFFGILADKKGRLAVLFGSILLYSWLTLQMDLSIALTNMPYAALWLESD